MCLYKTKTISPYESASATHGKHCRENIQLFFLSTSSCITVYSVIYSTIMITGSLGARISELKQKVIAEDPRRFGLAVPRKCLPFCCFSPVMYSSALFADFVSVFNML